MPGVARGLPPFLFQQCIPSGQCDRPLRLNPRSHFINRVAAFEEIAMGKRLYVGNLPYTVDSSQLEEMFKVHGPVVSAEVVSDRDTGRSKGFGFVEMANDDDAKKAIDALNGQDNGGRPLT